MGLLTRLLTLPLQPVAGVAWVAGQIAAEAERQIAEQSDPQQVLNRLAVARDRGEITPEEYAEAEEEILRRAVAERSVVLGRRPRRPEDGS